MSRYSKEIREQIRSEIKDMISDYENVYGCDLAYEMYNNDYYIIGTYKAKQELKKYFDDMCECIEQYKEEVGTTYEDITDAEKLLTLLMLFVAQDVLSESETLNEHWNEQLNKEMLIKIAKEI